MKESVGEKKNYIGQLQYLKIKSLSSIDGCQNRLLCCAFHVPMEALSFVMNLL